MNAAGLTLSRCADAAMERALETRRTVTQADFVSAFRALHPDVENALSDEALAVLWDDKLLRVRAEWTDEAWEKLAALLTGDVRKLLRDDPKMSLGEAVALVRRVPS